MDITQNKHTESVALHTGFYSFATEYIFMPLSTTKTRKVCDRVRSREANSFISSFVTGVHHLPSVLLTP